MISLLLVFFVICLCVLREVLAKIQNKSPPGPFQWPLIGNVLLMKKLSKQYGGMHVALQYLAKKYKTSVLSLKLGSENTIVVFGKDTVQKVLFSDDFIGKDQGHVSFMLPSRTPFVEVGKMLFSLPTGERKIRPLNCLHLKQKTI